MLVAEPYPGGYTWRVDAKGRKCTLCKNCEETITCYMVNADSAKLTNGTAKNSLPRWLHSNGLRMCLFNGKKGGTYYENYSDTGTH